MAVFTRVRGRARSVRSDRRPESCRSGRRGGLVAASDINDQAGPGFSIPGGDSNPEEFGLGNLEIALTSPSASTFPVSDHVLVNLSRPLLLSDGSLPEECCQLLMNLTFTGGTGTPQRRTLPADPFNPHCREACDEVFATAPFRVLAC